MSAIAAVVGMYAARSTLTHCFHNSCHVARTDVDVVHARCMHATSATALNESMISITDKLSSLVRTLILCKQDTGWPRVAWSRATTLPAAAERWWCMSATVGVRICVYVSGPCMEEDHRHHGSCVYYICMHVLYTHHSY
ncbi:hypothetical protein BS78_01G130200 [Paspalum vaginatum]|nr:hypothetical protein BS78_01G130200 [Paspalum vaginatum]